MSENNKNKSNFVAPLTKMYREKIKKTKEAKVVAGTLEEEKASV